MNDLFGMLNLSQGRDLLLQSLPRLRILMVVDGKNNDTTIEGVMSEINVDVT